MGGRQMSSRGIRVPNVTNRPVPDDFLTYIPGTKKVRSQQVHWKNSCALMTVTRKTEANSVFMPHWGEKILVNLSFKVNYFETLNKQQRKKYRIILYRVGSFDLSSTHILLLTFEARQFFVEGDCPEHY